MKLRRLYIVSWFVLTRRIFGPTNSRETNKRLRMMLRQTWLITLGVLLLFGSVIGAALYFESQPTTLRIAVGPANGEDAKLVQAIAQQLTHDRAALRLRPVLKDNSADSAAALDADQADLAVIRRDRGYPQQGLAVAVLRENVVLMMVPAAGSPATGGTRWRASSRRGGPASSSCTCAGLRRRCKSIPATTTWRPRCAGSSKSGCTPPPSRV